MPAGRGSLWLAYERELVQPAPCLSGFQAFESHGQVIQNITRDNEVKNNLTITRREWGEGITGTTIKDTWTKSRECGGGGGRWVQLGWGGGMGRKGSQL